jgi:P-type Cu+ transporter
MTPTDSPRDFDIDGMTCAACVARVERVIKRVPGVQEAMVNLATQRATIVASSDNEALIAAITRAGFAGRVHVSPFDDNDLTETPTPERITQHSNHEIHRAVLALGIGACVMVIAMVRSLQFSGHAWVQATLSAGVVWVLGASIQRTAIRNALHFSATMDTLIALGSNAAMALSLTVLLRSSDVSHLYFESASMIVAFVLLGRALEARARRKTGESLRSLIALRPRTARVVRRGEEREIAVSKIRVNDTLKVRAHERFPVDGCITEGSTQVDMSLLTGEPMPVSKTVGDDVVGATLNGSSPVEMVATKVGSDTALAQIVAMVERAQGSRAPIQNVADRVAGVFVPLVMAVAVCTWVGWRLAGHSLEHAWMAAVTVLVVACPCALGLATPTAIIVGTGRSAEKGILLRDAAALERAHAITDIVFDKTGTLTRGTPTLSDIIVCEGSTEQEILSLARALEEGSEHTLARAVIDGANQRKIGVLSLSEITVVASQGVRAMVENQPVAIGTGALVESALTESLRTSMALLRSQGRTLSVVTRNHKALGLLGISDAVREESQDVVATLATLGIRTHLLSGDHSTAVMHIAKLCGIDETRAQGGALPIDKGNIITALRSQGYVVAMVGDGVNDAPALALADVGFAMGRGTDVASGAASVTLMRNDLRDIVATLKISRAVMRVIRQNLFWAFVYNAVGVPLAALGVLEHVGGPMFAAGAMALSSVTVVSNSLRLKRA